MRPMTCEVYFLKDEAVYILNWIVDESTPANRALYDPIIKLGRSPTHLALGKAIRRALERSTSPKPWALGGVALRPRSTNEILQAAGIQSWSRLEDAPNRFTIEDDGTRITIRTSTGTTWTCDAAPDEIGKLLLEQFSMCILQPPLISVRPGTSYRRRTHKPAMYGGRPESFGCKTQWFVLDTADAAAVVSAFGLKDVRPETWDIDPYYCEDVFVSPSVIGWTYVLGYYVQPHFPEFRPLLETLSRRLGEVQYFGTHRSVGFCAWVKAIGGEIVRGYCHGELLDMDIGKLTPEEETLGFSRFRRAQTSDDRTLTLEHPGEDDVMQIAGKWSINPQELSAYESEGPGFLGRQP